MKMENVFFTQDISKYATHTEVVKEYEYHICEIDNEKEKEKEPSYQLLGSSGYWFRGCEFLNIKKHKIDLLENVMASKVYGDMSIIVTNLNSITLNMIKFLRSADKGYLIAMGAGVEEVTHSMKLYADKVSLYKKSLNKRDKLQEELLKAKKEEDKDLIESLSKKILKNKELVKSTKVGPGSFLIEHLLDFGVFNILRGFTPIFIEKDLMILKVSKNMKQGVTKATVEEFLSCQKSSIDRKLSVKDKLKEILKYRKSGDIAFKYKLPTLSSQMFLIENLVEFPDIDISSNIYMTDSQPVAPIKPHIIASLLASGTAGSLDKEVIINGEASSIKSVMLQDEKITEVFIDGEAVTEKISTWKPRLGIFNKLRKEVVIYKD